MRTIYILRKVKHSSKDGFFNEIPFTIKKQKKNGPFRVSVRLNFICRWEVNSCFDWDVHRTLSLYLLYPRSHIIPYHQASPWFQPGLLWAFPRESTGQPTKGTAKGIAKVLISKVVYKWIDCWRSESDCLNPKLCDKDRWMNFTLVICYGMVTVNKQQN